jgi:hypothetical protein
MGEGINPPFLGVELKVILKHFRSSGGYTGPVEENRQVKGLYVGQLSQVGLYFSEEEISPVNRDGAMHDQHGLLSCHGFTPYTET